MNIRVSEWADGVVVFVVYKYVTPTGLRDEIWDLMKQFDWF